MEFVRPATHSFTAAHKMKFATAGLKSDFHPDQFSKEILATGLELNRILIWKTWDRFKRIGTTYFNRVLNRERQEIPNTVLRAASETLREGWRPLCRPATANLSRALVCWCMWSSGYTKFSWKYIHHARRYHVSSL